MTASTEIVQFAGGGGANVLTQSQYLALTSVLANGFSAGIADPATCNKLFRQSAFMAAVVANWIVDQGISVPDDGNLTNGVQELDTALRSYSSCPDTSVVANTVTATVSPGPSAYFSGMEVNVLIANANTGASSININGLGAKSITNLGNALSGGELKVGRYTQLIYNGTSFDITSNLAPASSVYVGSSSTTGSANAQVLATVTPSGYALKVGNIVTFQAGFSNTSALTLNVSSTGALAVLKPSGTGLIPVVSGDIVNGTEYQVLYNGSVYQLNTASFPSPSTFLQVANNGSDVASPSAFVTNIGAAPASAGVPSGAAMWWPGTTAPANWIECAGQSTSSLSSTIQTLYGANLPDMRGQFPRAWDHSAGVDPGRTILSTQAGAIQSHSITSVVNDLGHKHSMNIGYSDKGGSGNGYCMSDSLGGSTVHGTYDAGAADMVNAFTGITVTSSYSGATETRPTNIAMMFIIKL